MWGFVFAVSLFAMSGKLRSRTITEGVQRSPNRAMLRAVGFGDRDFEKPIVGVANAHSTITPCNLGLDLLAKRAEAALKAAGAMPQTFGTITVSDGISMGTEGMKYSLVSREVIADSIETACNAQCMDGLLAVGGCDKNMPGAMIAMARMNIPAVFVYGGTIKPGHYKDRDLTVVSVFEAVGEYSARKIDAAELLGGAARLPGRRLVRRDVHGQHDVLRLRSDGNEPPLLLHHGGRGRREGRQCRALGGGPGPGHPQRPPAAAHPHAPGVRQRDRGDAGDRRVDQCRPPPARHRPRGTGAARPGRLRSDARPRAGAVRPEAVRALRHYGPAPGGGRSPGHAAAARPRRAARRGALDHGPDHGGGPEGRSCGAISRPKGPSRR